MPKTINGQTVRDLLDDYAGRKRAIDNCSVDVDFTEDQDACIMCREDKKELEKIITLIELAI